MFFFESFLHQVQYFFMRSFIIFDDSLFLLRLTIIKYFLFLQLGLQVFIIFLQDLELGIFLSYFFSKVVSHDLYLLI